MPKVEVYENTSGKEAYFYCPGCETNHRITIRQDGKNPSWNFNNNIELPTFNPSILVRTTKLSDQGIKEYEQWKEDGFPHLDNKEFSNIEVICHSYVKDGKIQFLNDSTHKFKGQTIDLPEYL